MEYQPLSLETLGDGGAWELAAIRNIHDFLSDRIEGIPILA